MSQSSYHLKLVSSTWQWVPCTPMTNTVTRSQSNRALLGCGGTGDLHHRQICSNYLMLSCQYGLKSLRNVSNTLLKECHEELRQFWRQRGVQPFISKVSLIKWPVSVHQNTQSMFSKTAPVNESSRFSQVCYVITTQILPWAMPLALL